MQVLITNDRLDQRVAANLFVRDLARALQERGHFVFGYGSDPRQQRRLLDIDPIPVVADLGKLSVRPDILHARHHLDAMSALVARPDLPAVFQCDASARLGPLPRHPRIFRYVASTPGLAAWLEEAGIPRDRVALVPPGIDLRRFARARDIPDRPTRAAFYGDRCHPDSPMVAAAAAAMAGFGIALDLVGRDFGRIFDEPEQRLHDYDIVFASGRNAVEALACGCCVVIADATTCGEMVTTGTFEHVRAAGYAPVATEPPDTESVRTRVECYSSTDARRVAEEVRRCSDFRDFAARIEAIYREAMEAHENQQADWAEEQMAMSDYLRDISAMTKQTVRRQSRDGDIPVAAAALVADVSANLVAIQASLDRCHWWPDLQQP
ncbi:MAG: glycosyltransferase [Bauldia sp.]|uniref:glycosyltransferase family 4 protein n=1 Tax=Bauldia sp. TaxID=2575872 RepID=UPI001D62A920|nr:glycosyltransferase family 4 protein [Bauldia sp.]MCB1498070.1 glycosyltransferase [Bauldia sp.]